MSAIALPSEPDVMLDREKLVTAVHYVAELCADNLDRLGRTKLHKVLYYADMLCFLQTGAPLTGVEYIKQPFGPTARHLGWALRQLSDSGALAITKRNFHGLEKYDFKLLRAAQTNRLSEHERVLLADVVDFVCGFSAKEISEISHDKPWSAVEFGARIPYNSAFLLLPQRTPSSSDLAWAEQQAANLEKLGVDVAFSR